MKPIDIPDYNLIVKCGRGAYGDVYVAKGLSGSLVALKIIEKTSHSAKEFDGLKYYCSRCGDSPYLIKIFHTSETESFFYYTMELADNCGNEDNYVPTTLANLLANKKRLQPGEVKELALNLLSGLETLHSAGLVHRDIKPENVILVNGIPKLSDIGLVSSVSATFSLGGTLGFIPPEKLHSSSSNTKSATDDLYALGKLIYCAFTGNSPDQFPSIPQDIVLDEEVKKLNEVILVACSKVCRLRFNSIKKFRVALTTSVSKKRKILNYIWTNRYYELIGIILCLALTVMLWRVTNHSIQEGYDEKIELSIPLTSPSKKETPASIKEMSEAFDQSKLRKNLVLKNGFTNDKKWKLIDSGGMWRSDAEWRLMTDAKGSINYIPALPSNFLIRFKIDYSRLDGEVSFFIKSPDSLLSGYQLRMSDKIIDPNEPVKGKIFTIFLEEIDNPKKLYTKAVIPSAPGVVEIVSTQIFLGFYLNGKLIHSCPTAFNGGIFGINVKGASKNDVSISDLEIYDIVTKDNKRAVVDFEASKAVIPPIISDAEFKELISKPPDGTTFSKTAIAANCYLLDKGSKKFPELQEEYTAYLANLAAIEQLMFKLMPGKVAEIKTQARNCHDTMSVPRVLGALLTLDMWNNEKMRSLYCSCAIRAENIKIILLEKRNSLPEAVEWDKYVHARQLLEQQKEKSIYYKNPTGGRSTDFESVLLTYKKLLDNSLPGKQEYNKKAAENFIESIKYNISTPEIAALEEERVPLEIKLAVAKEKRAFFLKNINDYVVYKYGTKAWTGGEHVRNYDEIRKRINDAISNLPALQRQNEWIINKGKKLDAMREKELSNTSNPHAVAYLKAKSILTPKGDAASRTAHTTNSK